MEYGKQTSKRSSPGARGLFPRPAATHPDDLGDPGPGEGIATTAARWRHRLYGFTSAAQPTRTPGSPAQTVTQTGLPRKCDQAAAARDSAEPPKI